MFFAVLVDGDESLRLSQEIRLGVNLAPKRPSLPARILLYDRGVGRVGHRCQQANIITEKDIRHAGSLRPIIDVCWGDALARKVSKERVKTEVEEAAKGRHNLIEEII